MTREPDHSPIESMCGCAPSRVSRRGLQTAESIGLRVRGNQASPERSRRPFFITHTCDDRHRHKPSMRDNEKVIGVARGNPVHQACPRTRHYSSVSALGQSNSLIYFTYNPRRINVLESEEHLVGLSRTGPESSSPSGQPRFASTQQIFSKKSTALSICCPSFDVRVGS